jgi:hypothetical protein
LVFILCGEELKFRYFRIFFTLSVLLLLPSCSGKKYRTEPGPALRPADAYYSLNIKANAKNMSSRRRQGIKILLKFTGSKARMLFLGPPLNKIYAKLLIDGESALLINSKKRKYWQGDFKTLLQEMWDVDFNYSEFKNLLVDGIVPKKKIQKKGISVSIKKEKTGDKPERIYIKGRNIEIILKISNRKIRKGKLIFLINFESYEKVAGLDDLLNGD